MRVAGHPHDIVYATTNYVNEGLKHPRKDNIVDFARGDVLMRIGNNDYLAKVIVGFTKNAEMVLYDVIEINTTPFDIHLFSCCNITFIYSKNMLQYMSMQECYVNLFLGNLMFQL